MYKRLEELKKVKSDFHLTKRSIANGSKLDILTVNKILNNERISNISCWAMDKYLDKMSNPNLKKTVILSFIGIKEKYTYSELSELTGLSSRTLMTIVNGGKCSEMTFKIIENFVKNHK